MAAYSVVNNFANFKNLFYKDIQIWILPSPHTFMQSPKITFFKKHFSVLTRQVLREVYRCFEKFSNFNNFFKESKISVLHSLHLLYPYLSILLWTFSRKALGRHTLK